MGKLFFGLVGLALLEMTVLIQVGSVIGALPTVALVVVTAMVGTSLVRSQGLRTLMEAQHKMQLGELPGREMMSGMMLALAGLLLIIPGFITDIVAVLLLQPALRNRIADKLMGSGRFVVKGPFDGGAGTPPGDGRTIEGEYERKD
ncbi:FxsA family protein [Aeromonas schubertii]|uniref:FxsA family protein n=1 Tax=Aeromonas schubertii TaxID=652 RepID=A0ABS7VAR9_9GAMM|nr:FxsA family protein [Aeromonas schubertii]KUE79829.1 FxsA protein [Aeromonas schubertii]MBZ6066491.1 FxsA family protein [Aeromonas schubertii]